MNKIANYLVKKAAKDNLDPEQTAFSWRHLFSPATFAALQGMNKEKQVQSNWDNLKLIGGAGAGALGGGLLGSIIGAVSSRGDEQGVGLGTSIGALLGTPLGAYLTHKYIANKRNLGEAGQPALRNGYGLLPGTAALALNGASPEQQVDANWDLLKHYPLNLITYGLAEPLQYVIQKNMHLKK